MVILLSLLLILSLLGNVYLFRRKKSQGNSHEFEEYLELKQDLSKFSGGIIEFRRIDPTSIFYRSTR
jgi:cbb3-type cytochrome oxidase subunit 3